MEELLKNLNYLLNSNLSQDQKSDIILKIRFILQGEEGLKQLVDPEVIPFLHKLLDLNSVVSYFVLEELNRCTVNDGGISFLRNNLFVPKICSKLIGKRISDSELSEKILVNLGSCSVGREVLFSKDGVTSWLKNEAITQEKDLNSTLVYRILSVIVQISTQNQQCFTLALEDGSLEILVKRINIEDELELLNSLELVEKLATTVHGLEYLISKGIFNHFISILQKDDDGAGGLIAEKLITITGNIFRKDANLTQTLLSLPIVAIYQDKLEKQQHEMPVISAIGALGRHLIGQKHLQENSAILQNLSSYFDCAENDLKVVLLNSLSEMFGNSSNENPNLHSLYTNISIDPPTTQIILNFIRKPFFDLRKAAYSVLYAISNCNWGISEIAATPGLVDLLMNRQNEPEIEGLTWRFSIFEKILENPDAKQLVGIEQYYTILEYAKRGIVFVPGQSEPIVKKEIW